MAERVASPLPVATLLRRARNAKSPKDRHDTAYYAWEVSVRLAVAAAPPADLGPLARGSVGHWVRAGSFGERALDHGQLLGVHALLTEVGAGKAAHPQSVTARKLLDALPAYRNQVIGHGSTRATGFYDDAAERLVAGLERAWESGVFLPPGTRLLYVEAVELDADGARRARLLSLSGGLTRVVDPRGTAGVPEHVLPRRVFLQQGDSYRSLHPWLLFEESDLRERVLFFNGLGRRAAYLDYGSGEALKGAALEEAFPGVEAAAFALFSQERADDVRGESDEPEDADLFGDYRILGKLGEGGMGVVYLARQESLGRHVALKMLPAQAAGDPTAVARFEREVAALGRCEHPNVVKILASGCAKGTHYYAMEYVEGANLSQVASVLASSADFDSAVSNASDTAQARAAERFADVPAVPRSPISAPSRPRDRYRQLAETFRDAALGLHHLHESGIVHRDVKPANLMVTSAEHRVVVMDLGLAAVGDASRSITRDKSQILGTLRYMPPEQLQRNLLHVDHRADIYALGATFYELLTGRPLFDGDSEVRLLEQVLREDPMPVKRANPAVPDDLATIVRKATEKDPRLRYDSAAALADDVDAYLGGRPIAAKPPTLGYVLRLAIRRNRALAATMAAALVVVVGLTAWFIDSLAEERNRAVDAEGLATQERERADRRADEAETARERAETAEREALRLLLRTRTSALAQTAVSLVGSDATLALLLALEAAEQDLSPTVESALRETLASNRLRSELPGYARGAATGAFSPDGALVAAVGYDGEARIWSLDGEAVAFLDASGMEPNATEDVLFTCDGRHVLTYGSSVPRVWSVDGTLRASLVGHDTPVHHAAVSPTADVALTQSDDGAVRLWDLGGACLAVLAEPRPAAPGPGPGPPLMLGVAIDPAGEFVAALDGSLRLWRTDGTLITTISGNAPIEHFGIDPEARRVVVADARGGVRVLDHEGRVVAELTPQEPAPGPWGWARVRRLEVSEAGSRVFVERSGAREGLAGTVTESTLFRADGTTAAKADWHRAFVPGSADSVGYDWDRRRFCRWDVDATLVNTCRTPILSEGISQLLPSPDGRHVLALRYQVPPAIWSWHGADVVASSVDAVAEGPDQGLLVASGTTLRHMTARGEPRTEFAGLTARVRWIRRGAGDAVVAAEQVDGVVRVWSMDGTPRGAAQPPAPADRWQDPGVRRVLQVSPSGTVIARAGRDKHVVLQEVASGRVLAEFPADPHSHDLSFIDDAHVIENRNPLFRICRVDGETLLEITRHDPESGRPPAPADVVGWPDVDSEQGRILLTQSDGLTRVHGADGRHLGDLPATAGTPVRRIAPLPGGSRFVRVLRDGRVERVGLDGAVQPIVRLPFEPQHLRVYGPERLILAGDRERVAAYSLSGEVIFDSASGEPDLGGEEPYVYYFDRRAEAFVIITTDRTLTVLAPDGTPLFRIESVAEGDIAVAGVDVRRAVYASWGRSAPVQLVDESGNILGTLTREPALLAEWTGDGSWVAFQMEGEDVVRAWPMGAADLLELARRHRPRELRADEWRRYREVLGPPPPDRAGTWAAQEALGRAPLADEARLLVAARGDLDAATRRAAEEYLSGRRDSANDYNGVAWKLVVAPGGDAAAYRRGVGYARRSLEIRPDDINTLNTLAVALYRVGEFEESLASLKRCDAHNAAGEDGPQPSDLAFLVMANHHLGRAEEAERQMLRLRAVMEGALGRRSEAAALFAEVAELLGESIDEAPPDSR